MELELPQDATCPLCEREQIEITTNKNDRPVFVCSTFSTPVNLRGDAEERQQFLSDYLTTAFDAGDESEPEQLEEPEGEDDPTVEDLFGGDENE